MAAIDTHHTIFASANGFGRAVFKALATFKTWNDARMTEKALSHLTDRELEDIGLCRGDIHTVARHH